MELSFEVEEDSEGESYRSGIPAADQPQLIGDNDYDVAESGSNNLTDLPMSNGDESNSAVSERISSAYDNEYTSDIDQSDTVMQSKGKAIVEDNEERQVATDTSSSGHESKQPVSKSKTRGLEMTFRPNRAKLGRWAKSLLVHKIKPNNKNMSIKKAIGKLGEQPL